MEKSKLKLESHSIYPDESIIEVWYEDKLIGTVYGSDGPGVRVISKYPMDIIRSGLGPDIRVMEVRIEPS